MVKSEAIHDIATWLRWQRKSVKAMDKPDKSLDRLGRYCSQRLSDRALSFLYDLPSISGYSRSFSRYLAGSLDFWYKPFLLVDYVVSAHRMVMDRSTKLDDSESFEGKFVLHPKWLSFQTIKYRTKNGFTSLFHWY